MSLVPDETRQADDIPLRDEEAGRRPLFAVPEPVVIDAAPSGAVVAYEPALHDRAEHIDAAPLRLLPRLAPYEYPAGRWGGWGVAVALTVAYFLLLLAYWAPAHPGVDQNGYLVGGRYLAQTGSTGYTPSDPLGFVGNMYVQYVRADWGNQVVNFPKYPVGLSLLYACFLWVFGSGVGSEGYFYSFLVSPIGTALAVLGTFATVRLFASSFAAICAMLLLGFSQVTLTLANNPNSHASCLGFVVWGGYFLIRFWQTGSIWRGLVGGFLLGFAVIIRYTEGLLALLIAWTAFSMWDKRARFGVIGVGLILAGVAASALIEKTLAGVLWAEWIDQGQFDRALAAPWMGVIKWALRIGLVLAGLALVFAYWLPRFGSYRDLSRRLGERYVARAIVFGAAALAAVAVVWFGLRAAPNSFQWTGYTLLAGLLVIVAVGAVVAPVVGGRTWLGFLRGWAPTLGWLIPVGYLIDFNKVAMGAWTGYDTTNESTGFTLDDFYANWERTIRQLHDTGLFFVMPIGLLGMLLMFKRSARVATMLLLWFIPGTLLYTAYYWSPEQGVRYLRFFMTLFPPVILGAGYLLYAVGESLLGDVVFAREYPVRGTKTMLLARLGLVLLAVVTLALTLWYVEPALRLGATRGALVVGIVALGAIAAGAWLTRRERAQAETVALSRAEFYSRFARAAGVTVAVGAGVAISCGIGLYRSVMGMEVGARTGLSIETAQRSNGNLARVGRLATQDIAVRTPLVAPDPAHPFRKEQIAFGIPAGSTVFANTNEMHYLQYLGSWNCYGADNFNNRFAQSLGNSWNRGPTPEDPHPVQGARRDYLAKQYVGLSDRDLVTKQNDLMNAAFARGQRVYLVLDKGSADSFRSRFLKSTKYVTKTVGQTRDIARIPTDQERADALDAEKGTKDARAAVAAADRRNRRAQQGNRLPDNATRGFDDTRVWQIVEVTPLPPKPASPATTPPATRPTETLAASR